MTLDREVLPSLAMFPNAGDSSGLRRYSAERVSSSMKSNSAIF